MHELNKFAFQCCHPFVENVHSILRVAFVINDFLCKIIDFLYLNFWINDLLIVSDMIIMRRSLTQLVIRSLEREWLM